MKVLLDTHIALWALTEDRRLSKKAEDIINDANNVIYYSMISLWEISIKHAIHPSRIPLSPTDFLRYCNNSDFFELSIMAHHVLALDTLQRKVGAPPHKDPFDKLLVAQAKSENMIFLTHDELIAGYAESCIVKA